MQESITRKDFLQSAFKYFSKEVAGSTKKATRDESEFILLPGVSSPDDYLKDCTQCYDCVASCPHESIRVWRKDNKSLFYGYPVIQPGEKPCYLCEDFPCIESCLTPALDIARKNRKLGSAYINVATCFAYQSHFCWTCVNNCPIADKAFKFDNNRPVVHEQYCTGCGICLQVCPVGRPAISIQINNEA